MILRSMSKKGQNETRRDPGRVLGKSVIRMGETRTLENTLAEMEEMKTEER